MKRLRVIVPCEPDGFVDAMLAMWLVNIVRLKSPGWKIEVGICMDAPVAATRNRIVREFLASESTHLLMIDSDQVPEFETHGVDAGLDLLMGGMEAKEVDALGLLTLKTSEAGPLPVVYETEGDRKTIVHEELLSRDPGIHRLENRAVVGGAGIFVSREILQRFKDDGIMWFREEYDEDPDSDTFGDLVCSEDCWFWLRCHDLGFNCYVDTRVFWGHRKQRNLKSEHVRMMRMATLLRQIGEQNARLKSTILEGV